MTDFDLSVPHLEEVIAAYAAMHVPPGRVVCVEHEALDRYSRSQMGILAPVMYALTGSAKDIDRLFMGRIVAAGRDRVHSGRFEGFDFQPNDVVLSTVYNLGYKFTRNMVRHYRIDARHVCGLLDPETLAVKPVGAYVLVEPAEAEAQRVINPGGVIWVPEEARGRTDDIEEAQGIKSKFGKVVSLGPGTWQDGEHIYPADYCQPGDVVQYDCSFHTLPLRIAGRVCELVECRQIITAERGLQEGKECQNSEKTGQASSVFSQSSFAAPVRPA